MITCKICEGRMYSKIEDECSITRCSKCGDTRLNGMGLPPKNRYYNLNLVWSQAVFDTVEDATKATLQVLQKRFGHEELGQIMLEWHEALHDEVIGE